MAATILDAKKLCANNADVGMNLTDSRLLDRINEAQRRLVRQHNFIVRREEYDAAQITWVARTQDSDTLLVDDLDATKLMVLCLWREENNQIEMAQALENRALNFVEQAVVTTQESAQKAAWQAALGTYAIGTFGYAKARIGLELADVSLRYSDSRIGRFVNAAEEAIMMKSAAVGTVEEYKIDVPEDGVILLPHEIESVYFAAFSDIPAPVYRQAYDWIENGPGYQTPDSRGWSAVLVARGEKDGRRRFFVRNPCPDECVRLLCKKRFIPKTANTDKMTVRNVMALREMATSLILAAPDPEKAQLHEQKALMLIEQELMEFRGGERGQVQFSVRGANRRFPRVR